uniref:Pellino E3 ubiquitin protein ligase 1a n=1 Tax=Sparus aurata TaxID=8175 RepID=A0A671WES1_SPAAU
MLSRFISSVFKGDKQQGAAQYFIHSVSGPDGGGGVHTRQQHGHVPDRSFHRESHRLRGDGHGARRSESGRWSDGPEHHLPLRLPHHLPKKPSVLRPDLRRRLRLLQEHLPGGRLPRRTHSSFCVMRHEVILSAEHECLTWWQEKAAKWRMQDGQMDGLTTNGVLVMHPRQGFNQDSKPGLWREISVCGSVFTLRETRSSQQRGKMVDSECNELMDGSLIDLCGATLLWRTAEGLSHTPTVKHLEALRQELNAGRPQCPVGFNTLAFPSLRRKDVPDEKQPWAYLRCGHVHGYHGWGGRRNPEVDAECQERECPMCRARGPYVPLWLGCEAGFYVDAEPPTHAFVPCGHVCSEKTTAFWSQIPLPHGTHTFHSACPFCIQPLSAESSCIRLIFQSPLD